MVVCFDDENKRVRLSTRQADILAALAGDRQLRKQGDILEKEEEEPRLALPFRIYKHCIS